MFEGNKHPSLAGGSLKQWADSEHGGGWEMKPLAGGIEAFKGRCGLSGNWAAGYVVVDWSRRPVKEAVMGLQAAINLVEAEGENLVAVELPKQEE